MQTALMASTAAVALAELGDKTQLLSLFLATRFRNHAAIIAGITLSTLLNHGISAWIGVEVAHWLPPHWLKWVLAASFVAIGLWLLIPDRDGDEESPILAYGAFVATLVLFFLAEIGDKTQIATVLLAARYNNIPLVVAGSTLGMLIANVPVVLAGRWLMERIPLKVSHRLACALFILLGLFSLLF